MYVTKQFRLKHPPKSLDAMARSVNFVWNYCNEWSNKAWDFNRRWLSGFDLNNLTSGTSKELGLPAQSIQAICQEHAQRCKQFKRHKLSWRGKKSLGWIPFKSGQIKLLLNGLLCFNGKEYRFWQSQSINGKVRCGSFSQDSKGSWYINLVVEDIVYPAPKTNKAVGVDLGLKTTATYSDGSKFDGLQLYKKYENQIGRAQRAHKKKKVSTLHTKVANARRDSIHKETTRVVKNYDKIYVGDVSSTKLVKTKMAKSVLDSGWGMYKSFLAYKTIRFGKEMSIVKENHSTITCSNCLSKTGPSGLSGLSIREWTCSNCGTSHDRDVNAARNILRFGHETPKGETVIGGCQLCHQ